MLLDFANAFNTVDHNLMLRLTAANCPELTNLVRWLYELEPHLVTVGSNTVRSSTGTQQGCTLSNPLFALVMEYKYRQKVGYQRTQGEAVLLGRYGPCCNTGGS